MRCDDERTAGARVRLRASLRRATLRAAGAALAATTTAASSSFARRRLAGRDGRRAARGAAARASRWSACRSAATSRSRSCAARSAASSASRCSTRPRSPTRRPRRAGRLADVAKVEAGGIDALIPELPARWLLPAHVARADLLALMAVDGEERRRARPEATSSAPCSIGPTRSPISARCACRRSSCAASSDPVTPVADHEAIAARIAGARLRASPIAATCRRSSSRPRSIASSSAGSRRRPDRAIRPPGRARIVYSTALTMSSTTFLASPKTIIVLSM